MEKKYKDMCSPMMRVTFIEKVPNTKYSIFLENWNTIDNPIYGFAIRTTKKPSKFGVHGYIQLTAFEMKFWKTYRGVKGWIKNNIRILKY